MSRRWKDDERLIFFTVPTLPCGATAPMLSRDVFGSATRAQVRRVMDTLKLLAGYGWVEHTRGYHLTELGASKQRIHGLRYTPEPGDTRPNDDMTKWAAWDDLCRRVKAGRP